MLDLFLVSMLGVLAILGLRHPAVAYAGYVWADVLAPQTLAFGFATTVPFSLTMAGVFFVSMMLNFSKISRPTSLFLLVLLVLFIVWFNLTTGWAGNPERAAFKLDWAAKSLGFTLLGFLVINNRQTLELYLLTFVSCASYFVLQTGIKTLLGGAAYGQELVYGGNNQGLTESSTLGGVAVACIPLIVYLSRYSLLFRNAPWVRPLSYAAILIFLVAVIGTHSRTGLVCMALLLLTSIMFVKKRLIVLFLAFVLGGSLYAIAGADWRDRMSTISSANEESSAAGRLVVWAWTLDYAKSHPFGGGFDAYLDNAGKLNSYLTSPSPGVEIKQSAVAYHNVFFEVLGEQGYPGIIIYCLMMGIISAKLWIARRPLDTDKTRCPIAFTENSDHRAKIDHDWIRAGATACLLGFSCVLMTGMFVGIAYRPYLFIFAISAAVLYKERCAMMSAMRVSEPREGRCKDHTLQ